MKKYQNANVTKFQISTKVKIKPHHLKAKFIIRPRKKSKEQLISFNSAPVEQPQREKNQCKNNFRS